MKPSPFSTLLIFGVTSLSICAGELALLASRHGDIKDLHTQNQTDTHALEQRRSEIQGLQDNRDAILAALGRISAGLRDEAPPPSSFQAFRQSGIKVDFLTADNRFHYSFSSQIEFHRLLPALTALENDYPLLRISELELISNSEPFAKAAKALHVRGSFILPRLESSALQPPVEP